MEGGTPPAARRPLPLGFSKVAGSLKRLPLSALGRARSGVPAILVAGLLGVKVFKLIRSLRRKSGEGQHSGGADDGADDGPSPCSAPQEPPEDRWHPLDKPTPSLPKGFREVARTTLPCTPFEFYAQVLSGDVTFILDAHTNLGKQYNCFMTPWKATQAEQQRGSEAHAARPTAAAAASPAPQHHPCAQFTRTFTFVNPKKPPQSTDTRCVQKQALSMHAGDVVVMSTVQSMLDIPFKECFTVDTWWVAEPCPDGGGGCVLAIHLKVHFRKFCAVSMVIDRTTFAQMSGFYREQFIPHAASTLAAPPPLKPRMKRMAAAAAAARGSGSSLAGAFGGWGAQRAGPSSSPTQQQQLLLPAPLRRAASLLVLLLLVAVACAQAYLLLRLNATDAAVAQLLQAQPSDMCSVAGRPFEPEEQQLEQPLVLLPAEDSPFAAERPLQ